MPTSDHRVLGTLALTHSSRATNLARCSPQFLAARFGDPDRLRGLPPFESLGPAEALYTGAVSFYRISGAARPLGAGRGRGPGTGTRGGLAVEPLGARRCRDKLQHVAWLGGGEVAGNGGDVLARDGDLSGDLGAGELLAGFEHRLERWRLRGGSPGVAVLARWEHPHLAGLHTVEAIAPRRAVLSCAAADAVLVFDLGTGQVERTLRLPESLYGAGYPLTPASDLRRHYIHDACQAAHPNAAFADRSGRWVAVSTLIQGAIGIFDLRHGRYQELTRGFVGCHGARFSREEEIYFADSATGSLVVLDDSGRIARRFATGSRWLHDVQQIEGSVFAFALADRNELCIYDTARGDLLYRRRFPRLPFTPPPALARRLPGWLGNSTQSLSFRPA